eukprot:21102_1
MGACCNTEVYEGDEAKSSKEEYKILFLGSGGCGKSTLIKQLRELYGEGLTAQDKKAAIHGIAAYVIETMKRLLDEDSFDIDSLDSDEAANAAHEILQLDPSDVNTVLTPEITAHIKLLWAQPSIKALFDETAKANLNGTCAHFFDSMDRIASASFDPTHRDYLLQRRPTVGIIEQWIAKTDYDGAKFLIVDVGGQKNERKKWIHQFENVNAMVYVISLSAYDEPLYEDETLNSLQDAISLFCDTMKSDSHWFKQSSLFLVFNKVDLFETKITNHSMKECFADEYDENEYWNDCKSDEEKMKKNKQFIKTKFMEQTQFDDVVTFETCAYEEDQVKNVFAKILKNIVA